ncbi:hypothetical protein BHE74_00031748 [Ensete ventricosum]|nr:hypothetical protein GW17_00008841 [Ensete ventricosum]RWW61205.1 hypothetical protein BHE74_00031748 [Ensete ventricosum]
MRFCNPSPLYRCCSSARCSVLSVLLCFPSQHIDTVDSKKSPSSAIPPQHIDTVAALPLLPVVIAARYFSILESCGVPHLFAASPLAPFWTLCLQHQAAATLLAAPKSNPNADTTSASPRTNHCLSCPLPLPHSACGCTVLKLL